MNRLCHFCLSLVLSVVVDGMVGISGCRVAWVIVVGDVGGCVA